jgi:hypothetical protein
MKGHIYQRTKDTWTLVFDLPADLITGKRKQKAMTFKGTKARCSKVPERETMNNVDKVLLSKIPE